MVALLTDHVVELGCLEAINLFDGRNRGVDRKSRKRLDVRNNVFIEFALKVGRCGKTFMVLDYVGSEIVGIDNFLTCRTNKYSAYGIDYEAGRLK